MGLDGLTRGKKGDPGETWNMISIELLWWLIMENLMVNIWIIVDHILYGVTVLPSGND